MRIGVGQLRLETNTANPLPTTCRAWAIHKPAVTLMTHHHIGGRTV
jgi:hypothetical protein